MIEKLTRANAKQIADKYIASDGGAPRHYCDEALTAAGIKPPRDADEEKVEELARLSKVAYLRTRKEAAEELGGIPVGELDKLVRQCRAQSDDDAAALPHWKVEPWPDDVPGAELLDDIKPAFARFIVLPPGAGDALALWVLHAWTMDAGDISPFLVLVSPTKRCGKTNTLIVLYYLTPRSELASNISASALFRYVEEVRPTLLIDEADSFLKDNEEIRGILNSGHTKTAAHVIRNVEVNGEHKPRRFSTWAPKAIATIRALADTLEDRAIVVQLQRKPRTASVERLRKRDSDQFATLRRKAARWAADNFEKLMDPDPAVPERLNDRAADNWRPLLAIADLAGGEWPRQARESACLLSGEGNDSAVNVRLLADARDVFPDADVVRSDDLIEKLTADPEKPWAEWHHGKPITQKQLAGLLRPFWVVSDTVHVEGRKPGKGYKRASFEEAWERYLPGQNSTSPPSTASYPDKRTSAVESAQVIDFASGQEPVSSGSKNDNLAYSHAGLNACPDRKPGNGCAHEFDQEITPTSPASPTGEEGDRTCAQCRGRVDGKERLVAIGGRSVWLHPECERFWRREHPADPLAQPPTNGRSADPWPELPAFLDRRPMRERLGPPTISAGPDDDLADLI